ncbi:MAG TPA: DUF5668 domain-containing protein [Actinomycetota bacterium]|nr:DUF5668 domain-containing protein [Actinomycetota bacterium]
MDERRVHAGALGLGLFYAAAGTLFLLDRLGVLDLRARYLLPLLLIGLGVAMLAGGRGR